MGLERRCDEILRIIDDVLAADTTGEPAPGEGARVAGVQAATVAVRASASPAR
jgi:hypothetical protein